MTVSLADRFPLYEALFEWRQASQLMRWRYYALNRVSHYEQELFYDALIQVHDDLASGLE